MRGGSACGCAGVGLPLVTTSNCICEVCVWLDGASVVDGEGEQLFVRTGRLRNGDKSYKKSEFNEGSNSNTLRKVRGMSRTKLPSPLGQRLATPALALCDCISP